MRTLARFLIVVAAAVIVALPAAWAQMRPECPADQQGACFTELEGQWSFRLVDPEGDAWQASVPADSPQDFFLDTPATPEGFATIHLVENDGTIFACRAGDFPACAFPPFPGLLQGTGTWLLTGSVQLDGLFARCPLVNQSTAIVADINTGERFKVEATLIMPAPPSSGGGFCGNPFTDSSVFDIKIRPIGP